MKNKKIWKDKEWKNMAHENLYGSATAEIYRQGWSRDSTIIKKMEYKNRITFHQNPNPKTAHLSCKKREYIYIKMGWDLYHVDLPKHPLKCAGPLLSPHNSPCFFVPNLWNWNVKQVQIKKFKAYFTNSVSKFLLQELNNSEMHKVNPYQALFWISVPVP